MGIHLYLTCYRVEALIASQLAPEAFGEYPAVGTEKRTLGQLMFCEINPGLKSDCFHLARARNECVPLRTAGAKDYPFPTPEQLDDQYHTWWKSASMA